jgi:hypothetical protein
MPWNFADWALGRDIHTLPTTLAHTVISEQFFCESSVVRFDRAKQRAHAFPKNKEQRKMIAMKPALPVITILVTAGLLAACSGAGSPPSSNGMPLGASAAAPMTHSFPISNDVYDAKCTSDNVKVKPCPVKLTVSDPSQTVTVTGPKDSTISVIDKKCSSDGIAEVEGTGSTWDVTAGTTSGKCTATFDAKDSKGHRVGDATLPITNTV